MSDWPAAPNPDDSDATRAADPVVTATRNIGPYRLLERLGEGGMGEVWLAEQVQPVKRHVALKLIKAGMDTAQVIARFEAERQALALMDHPAIARVFDAGVTDQGRPFFAMEYIRGESINSYCDVHALALGQRLELFLQVCEGVQHAHQRGIIHRDLKPSNILVTLQDDRPVPKIIDFGVAKATGQRLTGHTLHTALGGFVGTPEYMSPEQAHAGANDIDTRTDVYALGIVLYELLTGTLPLEAARLSGKSLEEILHVIRDVDPPRPSMRVTEMGPAATAAAGRRELQPKRLASALRGDLDWITMRAIEKDRTRRYGSASDLAADLRRHLTMQPVLASPPSATYRVRKFARRHRAAVVTAVSLVGLIVAGVVMTAVQTRRTAQERDRASLEAAAARQVSDFLVGLFRVSDPSEARGNSLTAREILDKGAKTLETLQSQPELQARLLATIGTVYTGLGSYRAAEPLLEQAVTIRRRVLGTGHAQTLEAVHELANLYWYRDRLADAEPLYNEVVSGRRRLLGAEHPDTLRAQYDLASLYFAQNRPVDAERLMLSTLEAQRRVLGETHSDTLLSLSNLGSLYHRQRRFSEAGPLREQVLDRMQRTMGADHPATLTSMHNLATTYDLLDKWDQAERLYLATITLKTRVFGARHEATVQSVASFAAMLARRREYASAEDRLLEQTTLLEPLETADPKAVTRLCQAFVSLYEAWGKLDKVALWRARLPPS